MNEESKDFDQGSEIILINALIKEMTALLRQ